mgnify:CR=1 FL=1
MTIIGNMLDVPALTDVTVTMLMGKPDRDGRFQVLGYRTADLKERAVTFWVYRKEAEEIARGITESKTKADGDFVATIDEKAWAFLIALPVGVQ